MREGETVQMSTRAGWVDAAKGIGILLVVLGHNQINSFMPVFHQYVYSFHMPLFFMLSGMFFKPQTDFFSLVKRRFESILRPYLIITILIYAGYLFFNTTPVMQVVRWFVKSLLYSMPDTMEWLPMWFLPHLFLLNLFAWIVIRLIYSRLPALWMRLLFLTGLLWCGVIVMRASAGIDFSFWVLRVQGGLPWSADLLLVTVSFFILGYEMRQSLPDAPLNSYWVLLVSGALWVALNIKFPVTVDLAARAYGYFPLATLVVLSGSLFVFALTHKLEQIGGPLFSGLKTLGKISIILLIFHGQIQFFTFYKVLELIKDVNLAATIAFAAGVGLPILIWSLFMCGNPRLAGWFGVPAEYRRLDE
jgi:fucose 4-O-acetylase-like acetyltransferase